MGLKTDLEPRSQLHQPVHVDLLAEGEVRDLVRGRHALGHGAPVAPARRQQMTSASEGAFCRDKSGRTPRV